MPTGQDAQPKRVKGTADSVVSPSQHLILLVERDDVETKSEFYFIHEYGKMKVQRRKEDSLCLLLSFFQVKIEITVSLPLEKFNLLLLKSKFKSSGHRQREPSNKSNNMKKEFKEGWKKQRNYLYATL